MFEELLDKKICQPPFAPAFMLCQDFSPDTF